MHGSGAAALTSSVFRATSTEKEGVRIPNTNPETAGWDLNSRIDDFMSANSGTEGVKAPGRGRIMMLIGVRSESDVRLVWMLVSVEREGVVPPDEYEVQSSILSAPEREAVMAEEAVKHAISRGMANGSPGGGSSGCCLDRDGVDAKK